MKDAVSSGIDKMILMWQYFKRKSYILQASYLLQHNFQCGFIAGLGRDFLNLFLMFENLGGKKRYTIINVQVVSNHKLYIKMFETEPRNVEMLNRIWIVDCLDECWHTFISKRLARVKFLSLAMDFWISLSISCQCRAFRDGFLRDVITGMPCLNSVTFSFKIGRTSLDGKPKKIKKYI